jgi:hypothetical protein
MEVYDGDFLCERWGWKERRDKRSSGRSLPVKIYRAIFFIRYGFSGKTGRRKESFGNFPVHAFTEKSGTVKS